MDLDPTVMLLAQKIKDSIDVSLNPNTSPIDRQKAYQFQEEFKSSSPYCADVGFVLSAVDGSHEYPVRVCGLQLIDFFIKTKWNLLSYEKKVSFKEKTMMFMKLARFDEHVSIKETVGKVVVEIIKRSWPQQWSSLFKDLSDLHNQGKPQTEMVLIVLMRLSEDINGLDPKLTAQRKKDMLTTLTNNADDLFSFFINTLQENAIQLQNSNSQEAKRLAEAAVYTITEFSSWLSFEILFSKDKILFQLLFLLLENKHLRMQASTCLEVIFIRKGANEKRVEMMVVLSDDVLNIIQRVVKSLACAADDDDYSFLKKLTDVLSIFARNQIASLWGDEKGFEKRPQCFDIFVLLLLELMGHNGMKVPYSASDAFHTFLVHDKIQKDEFFISIIPDILQKCLFKMQKHFNSTKNPNPWRDFNEIDFDNDKEMKKYFSITQSQYLEMVRRCANGRPIVLMNFCTVKIDETVMMIAPDTSGMSEKQIMTTDYWIYWDALAHFVRQFCMIFFKNQKKPSNDMITVLNNIVEALLHKKCNTPYFMSPIVSMLESMFQIFKYSQDNLVATIQMMNNILNSPDNDQTFKLKRQVCITFNNLCKQIPDILANVFEDLEKLVNELYSKNDLTPHEKSLLIEGLLRTSKYLSDKQMQKVFIEKTFNYINSVLDREDIKQASQNPSSLIEFLGFNKSVLTDAIEKQRKELLSCLYIWSVSTKALSFIENGKVNDTPSDQDLKLQLQMFPWIQPMINTLPKIINLTQQYALIWAYPEKLSNPDLLGNTVNEQLGIMGIISEGSARVEETLGKGQYYMTTFHDVLYTSLAFCSMSVGPSLYSLDGFSDTLINKIVSQWSHLPVYKLSKLLKHFVKVFTLCCPRSYYEKTLGPFLSAVLKFFFQLLSSEWGKVSAMNLPKQQSLPKHDEDDDKTGEVREERAIYTLSRDFIDMLIVFCTFKRGSKMLNSKPIPGSMEIIGDLGEFLLEYPNTNLTLICIMFSAITWPDASVAGKLSYPLIAVTRKVFTSEKPVDASIPNQIFMQLLKSLEVHGSDEMVRSLIVNTTLQVYIHLRMQYPEILKMMLMLPSCTEDELQKFDLAVFINEPPLKEIERKKKFTTFLSAVCGGNGASRQNCQE